MAKSIQTKFYTNATATCSNCKSEYSLGMGAETITLDICGNCHPFYTGNQTLIDTAGRIEKFQARAKLAEGLTSKKTKIKKRKFKQTLADLSTDEVTEAHEATFTTAPTISDNTEE